MTSRFRIAATAAALILLASGADAAVMYQFTVDTSSLAAGTQGFIELQFSSAGGGTTPQTATATVSNFQNAGGFFTETDPYSHSDLFGVPNVLGHVSGILPADVVLNDLGDGQVNDYLHSLQFGTSLSFLLTLDGQAINAPSCTGAGGTTCSLPGFALDFLNFDGSQYLLTGDPFFQTPFDWTIVQIQINADGSTTAVIYPGPNGGPSVLSLAAVTAVPEPATWTMLLLGVGAAARRRAISK